MIRKIVTLSLILLLFSDQASVGADSQNISFDRDIRPILSENCFSCHGFDENSREADLRLDTYAGAVDDGGVIVPGDVASSTLIDRIISTDKDEMMPPPETGHKLTNEQVSKIRQWVAEGAEYQVHWAFVPPVKSEPPSVANVSHPIDQFVQFELANEKLTPSPPAKLETLIRRVSLDLTGLPPTLAEIAEFEKAATSNLDEAYQSLVERLLASPHYGERWARWWLDQARYADSNGYSIDAPREIWKFRDWVVESLNRDMPFDQFTIEQLAGDLLPDANESQKVATGFHRNTQINQEGGIDPEQFRIDSVFDRVATTGTVWLGLTVGCAQCHDHKFDPIKQKEFYQLFAFLNNQDEPTLRIFPSDVDADSLAAEKKRIEKDQQSLVDQNANSLAEWESSLNDEAKKSLSDETLKAMAVIKDKRKLSNQLALLEASHLLGEDSAITQWENRIVEIDKQLDRGVSTMVLAEKSKPRKTTVFIKGDFTRPAEDVLPNTPSVLHSFSPKNESPNRLDLAQWIVVPENPLMSRVIVNRVWQQYFGRGLVETDSDFGLQGSSPTHPQLLDWLAVNFYESNWSLKELHRLIVTSHTYRQSSNARSELNELDPLNLLLGRQNRLRLDAEIVRDVALVASGLFSPEVGGPPVYPPIPDGVMGLGQTNRAWNASTGSDRYRRGLYTFVFRATPPPSLNVFDAPDGQSSCTRRIRSNTPLQALTLLNDAGFYEFAQSLEKFIEKEGVEAAFRRCTSRRPTEDEVALLNQLDTLGAARAILNLDETINRE